MMDRKEPKEPKEPPSPPKPAPAPVGWKFSDWAMI